MKISDITFEAPKPEILTSEVKIYRREDAARRLDVMYRTLYVALDIASLHIPSMKRFRSAKGGVNGKQRLTHRELPVLKKVLADLAIMPPEDAALKISENPQMYEASFEETQEYL